MSEHQPDLFAREKQLALLEDIRDSLQCMAGVADAVRELSEVVNHLVVAIKDTERRQ